jgi:hypothetical protein
MTFCSVKVPFCYLIYNQTTLAARGLEELFSQLCCCVSFWFWWEIVLVLHTHVLRVQYSCGVVLVFWLWREIVVGVCVCVFSTFGKGGLPSDAIPIAGQIHPPNACNVIPLTNTPSASPWGDVS